jgi:hypothetical protein
MQLPSRDREEAVVLGNSVNISAHIRSGSAALVDVRLAAFVLVNGRPFIETFAFEDVAKAIEAELAAAK